MLSSLPRCRDLHVVRTALVASEPTSGELTRREVSGIHQAWADGHEQNPLTLVQRTVLDNGHVESRFADGVGGSHSNVNLVDKLSVRQAGR